jgi:hypothetical protein
MLNKNMKDINLVIKLHYHTQIFEVKKIGKNEIAKIKKKMIIIFTVIT